MKKLLALVSVLAGSVLIFFLWLSRLPPFDGLPEPTPVGFEALSAELDAVRVSGTAHLSVKQRLTRPPRLGRPEATLWLFPLFAKGDTAGRRITAMVLTPIAPDALAGLEDMTVEAWVRPPAAGMSPEAEDALRGAGYSFADDYVLLEAFPPPEAP